MFIREGLCRLSSMSVAISKLHWSRNWNTWILFLLILGNITEIILLPAGISERYGYQGQILLPIIWNILFIIFALLPLLVSSWPFSRRLGFACLLLLLAPFISTVVVSLVHGVTFERSDLIMQYLLPFAGVLVGLSIVGWPAALAYVFVAGFFVWFLINLPRLSSAPFGASAAALGTAGLLWIALSVLAMLFSGFR